MLALSFALVTMAHAMGPTSLDDFRARRLLAPFLGAYSSIDDHDRATVVLDEGVLQMWHSHDAAPAARKLAVPRDLLNELTEKREYDAYLGWHQVRRSVEIMNDGLVYLEVRVGWRRRVVEFCAFHTRADQLFVHRARTYETRGVLDFFAWFEDRNTPEPSVRAFDEKSLLVRLSASPIPVDEFTRPAAAITAPDEAPPRGRVLPFRRPAAAPGPCATHLEE